MAAGGVGQPRFGANMVNFRLSKLHDKHMVRKIFKNWKKMKTRKSIYFD